MLHIVNGDVVGRKIKDIAGDIIVWREMYDFGPLMLHVSKEELIKKRAAFFEGKLNIPSSCLLRIVKNKMIYYRIYLKQQRLHFGLNMIDMIKPCLCMYSMNYQTSIISSW